MTEQVRQGIWIAESLVAQYGDVLRRYKQMWQEQRDTEQSALRAELERLYPAIWEHLDGAAELTRKAGRDRTAYDQIRNTPGLERAAAIAEVAERHVGSALKGLDTVHTFELTIKHNAEGLQFALRAAQAIKAAWPELDWTPPQEPEVDLRPRGFFARLLGR